jgi:hypothetical protein
MFSHVLIQEADIGLVPLTVSQERYEAIEFCGFVGGDNTGILVKYPAANISFTSAFDVFSIGVLTSLYYSQIETRFFKTKIYNRICRYGSPSYFQE